MAIINRIGDFQDDMTAWRRDLHAHPELGFQERRTSAFVAAKLQEFGVDEVHAGMAKTGVVGVLKAGAGQGSIALRADMDALPIQEATGRPYASTVPGKMHACGHDGHTTMLLGAARYLAETRNFDGTVYFIFQPAEELEGGGRVMVEGNVDPVAQGVVSITQFHGGDADNVIPQVVTLRGTCRSFAPEVRDLLERRIDEVARGVAAAHQVEVKVTYARGYPATVNTEAEVAQAAAAAADVAGEERVDRAVAPVMGAEDFAYMLERKPGAYIFMGGGGDDDAPMLHSPDYDFNDEALPYGASYWARLVERLLPAR